MKKLLFVCTGNTCRSPMAKVLAERTLAEAGIAGWEVASAGVAALAGARATQEAKDAVTARGLDLSGHRARLLSAELLAEADLILVMTQRHKSLILQSSPHVAAKVHTLPEFVGKNKDVPDPYGGNFAHYQQTMREVELLIAALAEKLKTMD